VRRSASLQIPDRSVSPLALFQDDMPTTKPRPKVSMENEVEENKERVIAESTTAASNAPENGDADSEYCCKPMRRGVALSQEIHDQYLICKICLEDFKDPKCLECMHTFCEECIENHAMSESSYKKYSDYRKCSNDFSEFVRCKLQNAIHRAMFVARQ
jgi:RING-type zinc-finger